MPRKGCIIHGRSFYERKRKACYMKAKAGRYVPQNEVKYQATICWKIGPFLNLIYCEAKL